MIINNKLTVSSATVYKTLMLKLFNSQKLKINELIKG